MSREMKDSGIEWIGEIPKNWSVAPILYGFSEVNNKNVNGHVKNALKFKYGTIIRKTNFDADAEEYVADTVLNYNIVNPGDIMINGLNLNYDFVSIRSAMVEELGIITSAYLALRPNTDKISSKYANYLFRGYDGCKAFHNMGIGMRKTLAFKEFKHEPCLFPSPTEQSQIVSFLDRKCSAIDTAIEKTKKSIEKLEEYKKAVITKAVTKGIDPNAKMKDSGIEWIGEIPEGWDTLPIKRQYRVVSGATPKSDVAAYWDGDIPWITPSDYKTEDKFVSSGKKSITNDGYDSCSTVMVPAHSIIFSKRAPVGTVAVSSNDLCTNQGCLSCVPQKGANPFFGYYAMIAAKKQFELAALGTTFMEISADAFSNFLLPWCNATEQSQIVYFLDRKCSAIDTAIEKKKVAIDRWEEYKKSLIYYAVTGKIDCRNEGKI